MKPKGWRLDPAWVEHYSKIERERFDREIERIHLAWQLEWSKKESERLTREALDLAKNSQMVPIPEGIKKFWRGDGWRG